MTAKVYDFDGDKVGEPVPEVVAVLEDWLERTKRGEVLAVAIAGAMEGAEILSSRVENDRWAVLLAAIRTQEHDMLMDAYEANA